MWKHWQSHEHDNVSVLVSEMELNKKFAQGRIHQSQFGTLDKQYASKCLPSVCQFYRMLDKHFDTVKHTQMHSDKCPGLKVFRSQPLVINHSPSVCQVYCTGTNGCVSGLDFNPFLQLSERQQQKGKLKPFDPLTPDGRNRKKGCKPATRERFITGEERRH